MTPTAFKIAVSALTLGICTIGCTPNGGGVDSLSSMGQARDDKVATRSAAQAERALTKGQAAKAVAAAEIAVAAAPQQASHRAVLGRAYLAAGRFASAEAALKDALTLDSSRGDVALSLALAQTAQGNWAASRDTLKANQERIAPADRGLAFALAGDPVLAVDILTNAVRAPNADAKTRQNLALALALAGRWEEAKVVAAQDVSAAEVDQRIMYWAAFTQPKDAADQVASLLGVTPAYDPGQPTRLALVQPTAPTALAVAEPVASPVPLPAAPAEVASVEPATAEAAPVVERVAAAIETATVTFLPRREIAQAIPAGQPPLIAADRKPVRTAARAAVAAPVQGKGRYVVQIGAYDSAGVAEDGWGRAVRRHGALANYVPSSMRIASGRGAGLTRVSVGGFATQNEAKALCGSLRASGGKCFVRMAAADAPVRWASLQRRYASR